MEGAKVTAHDIIYIIVGYLSGSVLYARVFGFIFASKNVADESPDKNPGTANAFVYGGFLCGVFTLLCDILKGFFPVYFYMIKTESPPALPLALVIAAPVVGHVLPLFFRFKGGKGIATSFGVTLGLVPIIVPVVTLAFFFIFFSTILRVTPHYHRTILTYVATSVSLTLENPSTYITLGFLLVTAVIITRLILSREEKEKPKVQLLWKR